MIITKTEMIPSILYQRGKLSSVENSTMVRFSIHSLITRSRSFNAEVS